MVVKRSVVGWTIAFCIAAGAVYYGFRPNPVPVDTASVDRGEITVTVDDEGVTRIKEIYSVSAPVAGRVLRSPVEVGDEVVRSETVVAVIEPEQPNFLDARLRREAEAQVRVAQSALAFAQAELKRHQAELAYSRNELKRAQSLSRRSTISEQALEKAELDVRTHEAALDTAKARISMREQELESARARALIGPVAPAVPAVDPSLCCYSVTAPESGRVLSIYTESERVVQAGTQLVEIGDPHDIEIVVDLLTNDSVKIAPGADVRISRWGGETDLVGRVRHIEPGGYTKVSALGIEEQRVNVIIDFVGDSATWRSLGNEFRVFVHITQWHADDVLKLPVSALFRTADQWAVYQVVDNRVVQVDVEIGHVNQHFAEVLAGLDVDDRVVMHPSDRVAHGVVIVDRAAM